MIALAYHQSLHTHYSAVRARIMGKPRSVQMAAYVPPRQWNEPFDAHVKQYKLSLTWQVVNFTGRLRIPDILDAVSKHYDVSVLWLNSNCRRREVAHPRHVAYYLARKWISTQGKPISMPEIARRTGGRDHTSVLSGIRRVEAKLATDAALRADIEAIERKLEQVRL